MKVTLGYDNCPCTISRISNYLDILSRIQVAMQHTKLEFCNLMDEGDSLEPIFEALDRKYAYTEQLSKPFKNEN